MKLLLIKIIKSDLSFLFYCFFKQEGISSPYPSYQANLTNLSQDDFFKRLVRKSRSVYVRRIRCSIPCVLSVCMCETEVNAFSHNTTTCVRWTGARSAFATSRLWLRRDHHRSLSSLSSSLSSSSSLSLLSSLLPFSTHNTQHNHSNCDVRMRGSKTYQTVQVITCGCR